MGLQRTGGRRRRPFLDLASAPDFGAYEQRYSAKARKNRRRLMRRLEERGAVAVVRHTGGERARAAALEAIALKRDLLEADRPPAPALADPRFAAFFADVAEGRTRPAGCGLTVLTSNGETAGIAIDMTCGRRPRRHILVHDPRLDAFGAGTLLLQEWIRGASAETSPPSTCWRRPTPTSWTGPTAVGRRGLRPRPDALRPRLRPYLCGLARLAEAAPRPLSRRRAWLRTPAAGKAVE